MLYTTTLENYDVVSINWITVLQPSAILCIVPQLGIIHDNGPDGLVLRVKCTRSGIPSPDRVYAMKVLPSYQQGTSTFSNVGTMLHPLSYLMPHILPQ